MRNGPPSCGDYRANTRRNAIQNYIENMEKATLKRISECYFSSAISAIGVWLAMASAVLVRPRCASIALSFDEA